jgi:dCMP deaminase
VGAIIVSKNDQVISQGFNGTPHGFSNICEEILFDDGTLLNLDNDIEKFNHYATLVKNSEKMDGNKVSFKLKTKPEVLHAETNAITKCAKYSNSTEGATLYVTLAPCLNCAKLIVQAEIARVCYKEDKDDVGINFLKNCGVIVEQITY